MRRKRIWTKGEIDELTKMTHDGLTISEMSNRLSVSPWPLTKKLEELNLTTKAAARQKENKELKLKNLRKCPKCENVLKISNFSNPNGRCYSCERDRHKESQLNKSLKQTMKSRIKASKNGAKVRGLEFDLTIEDLLEKYIEQEGKCFYTGIDMKFYDENKYLTLSIDRVDSNIGYIKDNIVLCCYVVNMMKFDMDLNEFKKWIDTLYVNFPSFVIE